MKDESQGLQGDESAPMGDNPAPTPAIDPATPETPTDSPKTGDSIPVANLETIGDELIERKPDLDDRVTDDYTVPIRDEKGNSFDPEIHEVDSDGNPKLTTTGRFRKKRGRKKGDTANSKSTVGGNSGESPPPSPEEMATMEGRAMAAMFGAAMCPIFGTDFLPKNPNEQAALEQPFIVFATEYPDFSPPPWVVIMGGIGSYVGMKMGEESVRENAKESAQKVAVLVNKIRGKRPKLDTEKTDGE